jgi:hypothetical protein
MHSDKLLQIANLIERDPKQFFMDDLGMLCKINNHICGTPGCIAGFVKAVLKDPDENKYTSCSEVYDWLGLTSTQGHNLCWMNRRPSDFNIWYKYRDELCLPSRNGYVYITDVTAAMAVIMLRKLASGEWSFDWSLK